MNLNISCYRCSRATCGQVWRIALVLSAVWGNRWNNPAPASWDTDTVTLEIVRGWGQQTADANVAAAIVCDVYLFSEQQQNKGESVVTSLTADWQVECKEDGVGRLEKAPCETNIALYPGLDNQWERR